MHIKTVSAPEEIAAAYRVRKAVFVEEQHVPIEIEIDEYEDDSIHFICLNDTTPIGASRLRLLDSLGKLERICVLKEYRGQSIGKQIIKEMEKEIIKHGINTAKLNAQTHAISFYESLGYEVVTGEFMDAGIPHVTMVKTLS